MTRLKKGSIAKAMVFGPIINYRLTGPYHYRTADRPGLERAQHF